MSEQHQFKTEVQKLLDLVIHSLYSNKEIFLREIISNASDAIDRARFESLKDESILENDPEWKIKITADKEAKTLTVSDNGIGMSPDEVEANIGTIASSGTKRFLQQLQESKEKLTNYCKQAQERGVCCWHRIQSDSLSLAQLRHPFDCSR